MTSPAQVTINAKLTDRQINASGQMDRQTARMDGQTTQTDGQFNAATSHPYSAAVHPPLVGTMLYYNVTILLCSAPIRWF